MTLVLLAGLCTACDARPGPTPPDLATPSGSDTTAAVSSAASALPTATPGAERFRPVGRTQTAKVVRVVDGDTIIVRLAGHDLRLRYIGMDTPETVKPDTPVQWMGPEATAANRALVEGRTVVLEKDVSETDRFGRLLRYVWLDDAGRWTLVDLELVRRGFAQVETDPPDVRYADRFRAAERAARQAGVGLWGAHATASP